MASSLSGRARQDVPEHRDEARGVAPGSDGGVQDLSWVHHGSGWILASINGPSLLCIWETSNSPRVL